jgi:hypothetical protein
MAAVPEVNRPLTHKVTFNQAICPQAPHKKSPEKATKDQARELK